MKKFAHKKSLGQNFLTNKKVVEDIVSGAQVQEGDVVLEIGPGQGALTAQLAKKAQKVVAIELDDRLIPELNKRFAARENVEIIHGDILHMNIEELISEAVPSGSYKVVANIPYYITAPIIRLFLETESQPEEIVLMVQKEVAERLCAQPGSLSVLGISAQYYADVNYLFTVGREEFDPVPAVDSAIVQLKMREEKNDAAETKQFFRTVKIGFSAKRKKLLNNIANGFHEEKKTVEEIFEKHDIALTARAQELDIAMWKKLANALEKE